MDEKGGVPSILLALRYYIDPTERNGGKVGVDVMTMWVGDG